MLLITVLLIITKNATLFSLTQCRFPKHTATKKPLFVQRLL